MGILQLSLERTDLTECWIAEGPPAMVGGSTPGLQPFATCLLHSLSALVSCQFNINEDN